MNGKFFIFYAKHDENLMALNQECFRMGIQCIPINIQNVNIDSIKSLMSDDDYIMVLHFNLGSHLLHQFLSQFTYKKCLNFEAFSQCQIGEKTYQQIQVGKLDESLTIPTYTATSLPNDLPLPLIAKPLAGSCGDGVRLITKYDQINLLQKNYIIQPYIPNNGDWRVVVVGGKAVSAIKRLGKVGQATNNIATGSFAVAETDNNVLNDIFSIAEVASRSMRFDYVGVDIIKNIETENYYFLETNERATFETSQILTGINIAKYIIETLVK